MEKEIFKKTLEEKAKQFYLDLSNDMQEQFYKYMNLLLEWNQKMNLTAITEPEDVLIKHFVDSLSIVPYINENDKIIDIGTGARISRNTFKDSCSTD